MTHNHRYDADVLEYVVKKNPTYIGLMGSASKWKSTQELLLKKGITKEQIETVTCPIGDKSVGKGPAEISIGVANQLLKKYSLTFSEK
jgi:xanthine dehydrogenase accessory factor